MLLAVHEDPRPDFLHDYVKFDPYLTIGTTFITYHSEFAIVKIVTTLGYGCDQDLGEPKILLYKAQILMSMAQILIYRAEILIYKVRILLYMAKNAHIKPLLKGTHTPL